VQKDCVRLFGAKLSLSLMISKQARNRQQLRLLVIIVVTKYSTLAAKFLNARLLK